MPEPTAPEPAAQCRNCRTPLAGRYCHSCGQQDRDLDGSVWSLLTDWIDAVVGTDARLWRTLRLLATRPGALSVAYLEGKRVAYIPPLRLFVVASLVLFVVLALTGYSVVVSVDGNVVSAPAAAGDPDDETPADDGRDRNRDGRLGAWIESAFDDAGSRARFNRDFQDQLAKAVFLLVPVSALLLMMLFRTPRRPYLHHLVFAVHVHVVGFLLIAAASIVDYVVGWRESSPADGLAVIATLVYLVLALRRVFGQSRLATGLKASIMIVGYLIALVAVVFGVMLLTLWRLV